MSLPVVVTGACEGPTDAAVIRRLLEHCGLMAGDLLTSQGKARLLKRLRGYNNAARFGTWLVLVDLNSDEDCAPPFVHRHLENPASGMVFRVAVRAVEAWLLADQDGISDFFRVQRSRVPASPEAISDPKQALAQLAVHSRSRAIREDMAPRTGSGRKVGPAFTSRVIEFVSHRWSIPEAAMRSPSLGRAVARLERLEELLT